jgi:hypothetical protein
MFAVMKTFVTVISASTGRNDFIFDIWLWHGDLYRETRYKSPCQNHISNIKSFLPVEAEITHSLVTKVWTDGRTTYIDNLASEPKRTVTSYRSTSLDRVNIYCQNSLFFWNIAIHFFLSVGITFEKTNYTPTANMKNSKSHCKQEVDVR